MPNLSLQDRSTEFLLYAAPNGAVKVGYWVNSVQATQFRIWATQLIKEYLIKGFSKDDEHLKNGHFFSMDYFKALREGCRQMINNKTMA